MSRRGTDDTKWLPKEEPGIEEGDWLDYVAPLRGLLRKGVTAAASAVGRGAGRRKLKDLKMPEEPRTIDYSKISTRPPTNTRTEATTGFKPRKGIKFEKEG